MPDFTIGEGRTRLHVSWQRRGADLHVHLHGGRDHLGAVALVGTAPDGTACGGTLAIPPHREGELVERAARRLHSAVGGRVCVTAGIHLDDITPAEIDAIRANAEAAVTRLAATLGRGDVLQSPHA